MNNNTIGFYVDVTSCKGIFLDKVLEGNPGVGGTEYITIALALLLQEKYNVILYSNGKLNLNVIRSVVVDNVHQAIELFDQKGGGVFIYYPVEIIDLDVHNTQNTRFIVWRHSNTYSFDYNKIIGKSNRFVVNVFLTKHQLFSYAFFKKITRKSIIIGHFQQFPNDNARNFINTKNVTFIGSTVPNKSLIQLIEIWKDIVNKCPGAHLNVCGSSSLYYKDNGVVFGFTHYEKTILKIVERDGVGESVSFYGSLNKEERDKILSKTKVGVVNPSNICPETFCLSTLEFASWSIPVVGGRYGGLIDTIPKGCGYTIKNKRQLKRKLLFLLNNDEKNAFFGINYKKKAMESWSLCYFRNRWISLIEKVFNNDKITPYRLGFFKKTFYTSFFIASKIITRIKIIHLFHR